MCTTHASSDSSSLGNNLKENNEAIEDTILNIENITNKQKEKEEDYFKENINTDFNKMILEKSKDERFAKVYNVNI